MKEKMKEKITQIKASLKALPKDQRFIDDLDYLTFLGTLLPIPIYKEAAQLIHKFVADHKLNTLMTELRNDIYETNTRINKIENDEQRIKTIASTVNDTPELKEKVDSIFEEAQQDFPSEFIVETETWSTQTIINQIINTNFTSISATDNSHNHLDNVEINSPQTHLRATNYSSNYLKGTEFKDDTGHIGMNGITQKGDIQVTGSSVTFGEDGTIIFGNENEVEGKCPTCHETISADKSQIKSKTYIKCPYCYNVFKIVLE